MTSIIEDRPDLLRRCVPDYPASGKRMLQDNGTWLRTLMRPDVELVRTGIERIVPDGVVTDGRYALPGRRHLLRDGFPAQRFPRLDGRARHGTAGRCASSGATSPSPISASPIAGFPNLFCVYGPGTNLAAGASLFYHSEFQVHYAMEAIRETLTSGARACEVTQEAYEEYARRYQDEIGQMVWSHPSITHSHYKNPKGKIFTLSPWPLDLYWEWTRRVDRKDYAFQK